MSNMEETFTNIVIFEKIILSISLFSGMNRVKNCIRCIILLSREIFENLVRGLEHICFSQNAVAPQVFFPNTYDECVRLEFI